MLCVPIYGKIRLLVEGSIANAIWKNVLSLHVWSNKLGTYLLVIFHLGNTELNVVMIFYIFPMSEFQREEIELFIDFSIIINVIPI